ncbi:hypothetical protein [Nonomuraea dietziae]|uniref:hypothetical protein n=1 Tax=Nonomuraea dietziae TaxID=65515 RepID=UPI0031D59B8F
MLRQEADPFIDWVAEHRGERADTYRLTIPHAYAEAPCGGAGSPADSAASTPSSVSSAVSRPSPTKRSAPNRYAPSTCPA